MTDTVRFLAARTDAFDVGLEIPLVLRVVSSSNWRGPTPTDLEELLPGMAARGDCRHVLVCETKHGECYLGTAHDLVLRECPAADVHAVPALVSVAGDATLVERVALPPDAPPLLVLDRDVLEKRLTGCS